MTKAVDNSSKVNTGNLTVKQRKFVAHKVAGETNRRAYISAGYSDKQKPEVLDANSSRLARNVKVQQAIDNALADQELTPELAVMNIGKIANDTSSKDSLKANTLLLQLHGWSTKESLQVTPQLRIDNAFFTSN